MSRKLLAAAVVLGMIGAGLGAGSLAAALGGRVFAQDVPAVIGTEVSSQARTSARFPKAGIDAFESLAEVAIVPDPNCATGAGTAEVVRLGGPTVVQRGKPTGKLVDRFQTEITHMSLSGHHPELGPVLVSESPTQASVGMVQQIGKDKKKKPDVRDLPAQSFFDVFVEIQLPNSAPGQTLSNQQAVRMQNDAIRTIPPIGSQYRSSGQRIPLFFANGAPAPFCIVHAVHVPEDPSHIVLFSELLEIKAIVVAICQSQNPQPCILP